MANSGAGQRRVVDVMVEMSYHLIESVVNTPITSITAGGYGDGGYGDGGYGDSNGTIFGVGSTVGFYVGAEVILGYRASSEEIVTVLAVDEAGLTFTCSPVNTHVPSEVVFGATFPTQQPTDPLYTQSEIQGYLASAQNDFLTKVPLVLEIFPNRALTLGQLYQPTPGNAIELERVAVQSGVQLLQITIISRTAGIVTVTLQLASNFTTGLPVLVFGVIDRSFNSVGSATFSLTSVSADGKTLTWLQTAADATSSQGSVGPQILSRLYESSQTSLSMQDPQWFYNTTSTVPTNWFEDRTGVYQWGVAPVPDSNFFVELIASVRDSDGLGLLDGFLLPDIFVPYIKYCALADCLSKAGEQRSPTLARFYQSRYDFGVMLADRFLRAVVEKTGQNIFAGAS